MSGYRQDGGLRTKGLFLKTSLPAKPLVSVVTPVYNAEDTIAETINSIISQSYENIEYIIIDGGSNDGTLEIIKAFEDRIAYWLSEKDGGMYEAVNKGFRAARGEIASYLNADDIYNPGAVAIAVGHF
jgi:glycosyltransferase involved in cell wall biosynthesis